MDKYKIRSSYINIYIQNFTKKALHHRWIPVNFSKFTWKANFHNDLKLRKIIIQYKALEETNISQSNFPKVKVQNKANKSASSIPHFTSSFWYFSRTQKSYFKRSCKKRNLYQLLDYNLASDYTCRIISFHIY